MIEASVYVLYAVPMLFYVLWPDRFRRGRRRSPEVSRSQGAPAGTPA